MTFLKSFLTKLPYSTNTKLGKFITTDPRKKSIKILKGAPTIYNPTSSASNPKGYLKAKIPSGIYFTPAQSSPTGSINSETIPVSFMSKDDPRKSLYHVYYNKGKKNPKFVQKFAPPILQKKNIAQEKKYHLTPKDVEEIQRLRNSNPDKYTRKALAEAFNVSPLVISLVSSAKPERLQEMEERLKYITSRWNEKRRLARQDRAKRNKLWYKA
ncbi:mitochondrial 54S ribosomal protein mL58 SCDLUD_003129 [Saccharomycodes ludwigii]|uniref:mitochondrial 54S ribosomal protein mL58 n=1 Tax=Saccharomycodes ludwigii TaxID=36035 RepID=UPI001E823809|nr:hypothetical protein SCDLUD_003129 [Saccharomycodes ludwigii]KAH3900159.1 hypothetical protein SCDLUD_003129 [Saccharomycodes ludwigii]